MVRAVPDRRNRPRALGLVALITLGALPLGRAHADPFHAQGIPLGQRALGFGGAFTGLADDPSAAYYNPAGLVWAGDSALSASLTLNAFDRRRVDGGYRTDRGTTNLRHSLGPSLPGSVSVLKRIGKRKKSGERKHAIGLSSFTVEQRSLGFDVEVRDDPRMGLATLSMDRSARTAWSGFSYAYRISDRLSIGMTSFLSIARTQYRDELISSDLGVVIAESGAYQSDAGRWESHRVATDVKNLVSRLGVLYQVNQKLRMGLMLQPPSIHVQGQASVRQRVLDIDNADVAGSFLTARQGKLASHDPQPWEIRLGASYKLYKWLTLALDASLTGADGTKRNPIVTVGRRTPNAETGAVAEVGYFEVDHWHRPVSGNLAMGSEMILWDTIALRTGLFTSFSSSPPIPRVSMEYRNPDVHRVGGAVSLGINAAGFDMALGVAGMFGRGNGLALDTREDEWRYRRTKVADGTLFVFLTGMRSVVARLAKTADKMLDDMRKEREREAALKRRAEKRAEEQARQEAEKVAPQP